MYESWLEGLVPKLFCFCFFFIFWKKENVNRPKKYIAYLFKTGNDNNKDILTVCVRKKLSVLAVNNKYFYEVWEVPTPPLPIPSKGGYVSHCYWYKYSLKIDTIVNTQFFLVTLLLW